ncbi:MAG: hypothetical protein LC130_12030 [Bryobacterales bacterium]|nr:hypothetical protein [Bryobacterales bacterium]
MKIDAMVEFARLWPPHAIHDQAATWVQREGAALLELSSSQLGALEQAVHGSRTPAEFSGNLGKFLEKAAGRKKGAWTRLREKLPEAFDQALHAAKGGTHPENKAYNRCKEWLARDNNAAARRDLEIQREFLAALIKTYRQAKEQKKWPPNQSAS